MELDRGHLLKDDAIIGQVKRCGFWNWRVLITFGSAPAHLHAARSKFTKDDAVAVARDKRNKARGSSPLKLDGLTLVTDDGTWETVPS